MIKKVLCDTNTMISERFDAAVVGAGPAGLLSAAEVARGGHRVIVFEEHDRVGEPDHCAGLLSESGLRTLRIRPPRDVILNHARGARINSPSGSAITIERGRREAVVVDRRLFDAWLAERAQSLGAEVRLHSRVTGIRYGDDSIIMKLRGADRSISGRIVINGEGSTGVISRQLGMNTVSKHARLSAYQYELRNVDTDADLVEMFYSRKYAPGFFLWVIPLGGKRARIGLAAKRGARLRLRAALAHHPQISEIAKGASIERGMGGVVLVGRPLAKTYADHVLLVGDAAGMVKATTGGGVILGGIAARIAGRVASLALAENDVTSHMLKQYQQRWKGLLGQEFLAMYLTQRLLSSLTDRGMDELLAGAKEYGLVDVVRREGDMDRQKQVIMRLFRNPRTILTGLRAIRHFNPFF